MQRPPTAVTYLCKVKVSIPVRYVVHSLTAVCGRGREYILISYGELDVVGVGTGRNSGLRRHSA